MPSSKLYPGQVRDAIFQVLAAEDAPMSVQDIERGVSRLIGPAPSSSILSYLRLNTPRAFLRGGRGMYSLRKPNDDQADVKPAFPQF